MNRIPAPMIAGLATTFPHELLVCPTVLELRNLHQRELREPVAPEDSAHTRSGRGG